MKYISSVLFLLSVYATSVSAVIYTVYLGVSSDDETLPTGLSSIHEGAGINYFFLGEGSQNLTYDDDQKLLYFDSTPEVRQFFSVVGNIVQLTVAPDATEVNVDGPLLAFQGSTGGFYAQKNINDPYRYSQNSYALVHYDSDAPEDAIPVNVTFTFWADVLEPPTGLYTFELSTEVPESTKPAPYTNNTVTTHVTYTEWVTTCTEATTITITTCSKDICKPTTCTFTGPTTVTITGPKPTATTTVHPPPPPPPTTTVAPPPPTTTVAPPPPPPTTTVTPLPPTTIATSKTVAGQSTAIISTFDNAAAVGVVHTLLGSIAFVFYLLM